MYQPPRELTAAEIGELLSRDLVAVLATLGDGFPHLTPIWFVWSEQAFWLTSYADRPHVARLRRNPRAALCVQDEGFGTPGAERPNRQVRAHGLVEMAVDSEARWTEEIDRKYLSEPRSPFTGSAPARVVMRLSPQRLVALASG